MIESGTVILGKYKIIKKIGRGGMSVVYLAEDINLGKKWTIKEIKKNGKTAEDKVNLKSLIDEANLIKKLDHPFIPRIVDIIDKGDTVFIVRDYIDGEPMDRIIKNFGIQPEKSVVEWAKIICDIYLYLHGRDQKIIYRDMKPANIMLVSDGSLRLIDFGIAHEGVFANKTCVGTKGFAPPEQFKKEKITDERTDIYSLGMTLYQMMTNINPADVGFDKNLLVSAINPKGSQEFAKIIDKCIQDNPEDRYQNCSELLYALNRLSDDGKKSNKKFSLAKILPYTAVALGTLCLCLALMGQSLLPFPETWFSNPIINVKNICLVLAVVFYALFGEFRYLSVKKAKSRSAKTSIQGNTSQYVVPTASEGSLFDAIQNPEIYSTNNIKTAGTESKKVVPPTEDDFETGGTQLLGYAPEVAEEEDDFETGGTQLLGYAPEVAEEEDDFETGGTQLLGYASEVAEEEDDFETGGTQLLGYAPEVAEEEDDFETGGTQLLGYAYEVAEEEDDFETGGTQFLGYAPEVAEEEDDFETGGTQLLQAEKTPEPVIEKMETPVVPHVVKPVEPVAPVTPPVAPPVRKPETKVAPTENVQVNPVNKLFKIIKSEIHLASDDIVM